MTTHSTHTYDKHNLFSGKNRIAAKRINGLTPTSLVVMAAVLSACGGGGGGAPPSTYQNTVTSTAAPSYVSTEETTLATQVFAARQDSGAGLLAQNNHLDQAAASHAAYLVYNLLVGDNAYLTSTIDGELGAHYEDSSKPGYTGATPQARATTAGYTGTVTELISFGAADATACFASQADSVYHLIDLLSPFMDAGLSFNPGNGIGSVCAIELGVSNTTLGQLPAAGDEVVYPYDQATGVEPMYYNQAETPNPALDLSVAGQPVAISLYTLATPSLSASDIVVQSFSLSPSGGNPVTARILASTGVTSTGPALQADTNIVKPGFMVLLPVAPLATNTQYTANFAATVKGATVTKTWSFMTGAQN